MLSQGVRANVPAPAPVLNWSVALYRKAEPSVPLNSSEFVKPNNVATQSVGSFFVQLQTQASRASPSLTDVLHFRYQAHQHRNTPNSYTLPFTISLLNDMKLSPDSVPLASTRTVNANDQAIAGVAEQMESPATLLLRAKAFLGVLILNSSSNSTTSNTAGVCRPFLLFVTDEVFIGQLFDAYIFRISQVATISLRDNPEDETFASGIKKLFQARCFYYATHCNPELVNNKNYFKKPYDITLCAQRMVHDQDSDSRFFWNRALCLPLLKFDIDVRYWIPKVMCGGIETHRNSDFELWLISRLSCERAGTRFNVRGVNDDGAVANFVETEQIVFVPKSRQYSSFVIVRGSIPLFWKQPQFQVGAHRITISRSEALSFRAFFEHFKHLYRHYGRILIVNLIGQQNDEQRVGEEYRNLFFLLVKNFQSKQKKEKSILSCLSEKDFTWFDYHEQAKANKTLTPELLVEKFLIRNTQYPIRQELDRLDVFSYSDEKVNSLQKGVLRINCIDCLDRTNNVQLAIGIYMLAQQLTSLNKPAQSVTVEEHLKELWINNGDHISRIYTGTGAIGQRNKAKDIQRSVGRAIQNSLRDEEKQQSIQTLIYSYAKDSYLHERSVAGLWTPYVFSYGTILTELYFNRPMYTRKEKFRVSIGTWNINGDKNPALEDQYPAILDAWILDGPENISLKNRKDKIIPTIGYVSEDYAKSMPDILAIGFQEICDLTATNMVWQSSVNATRWVENVQSHFKKAYPNDEYILLGNDQLVGVCLSIFIRRDLAPFVRNIHVDSVKTGMGGKIGNKGCVAIRLVLHNTSICFICAHFTAGQNEVNERNKDYKSIMEKLSFQAPSRALWHDHIFFLGDFNYRLTLSRAQVEHFVKNQAYQQLLEYDQLKKEHADNRVFREFEEGPIRFSPTYKYDVGTDDYDTSEKARVPSYTDRILWRSYFSNVQSKLVYYGRAEVKTSDHRPVSAMFDIEVEVCDEQKVYQKYMDINERNSPSNGQVLFEFKNEPNLKRNQLIEELDNYVRRNYGTEIMLVDRFFINNSKLPIILMCFGTGEMARKVLQPKEGQLSNGIVFNKCLINANDDYAFLQRQNLFSSNINETMYSGSTNYDLGTYQQPSSDSLSTNQDVNLMMNISASAAFAQSFESKKEDENVDDFDPYELIKETQRAYEQRRRRYEDRSRVLSDSEYDDRLLKEKADTSSSSSDPPTSTDSDAPYGSDSESSSSYDEYYAERKMPKKKVRVDNQGPIQSYFRDTFSDWPKYRYRLYKRNSMKRQGIPISYGNEHTKEIESSLKKEKHDRKKDEGQLLNLISMMEPLVRQTELLALDPQLSNRSSVSRRASADITASIKTSDRTLLTSKPSLDPSEKSMSNEDSFLEAATDVDEQQRSYNVGELISFASFDYSNDPFAPTPFRATVTAPPSTLPSNFDPFNLYSSQNDNVNQRWPTNSMTSNSTTRATAAATTTTTAMNLLDFDDPSPGKSSSTLDNLNFDPYA